MKYKIKKKNWRQMQRILSAILLHAFKKWNHSFKHCDRIRIKVFWLQEKYATERKVGEYGSATDII